MTGKQKAFVEAYANPNSKTVNNARASALAAHYSIATANQACVILVDNCSIKEGIEQYLAKFRAEQAINVEYVRQRHLQAMERCWANDDMVNYTRNLEGLGKSAGVYIDKTQDVPVETTALDEKQALEANRLANIRLREGA